MAGKLHQNKSKLHEYTSSPDFILKAHHIEGLTLCQSSIPGIASPGARRAVVWGTGSALKYRRTLAVFLSVIPRILKAQSSATPSTLSSPFWTQQSGPSHHAENVETAMCCGRSQHEYPKSGQVEDSFSGGEPIALAASLLFDRNGSAAACAVPVRATVIAVLGAAVTYPLLMANCCGARGRRIVAEPRGWRTVILAPRWAPGSQNQRALGGSLHQVS
jgi:hypothetical protein